MTPVRALGGALSAGSVPLSPSLKRLSPTAIPVSDHPAMAKGVDLLLKTAGGRRVRPIRVVMFHPPIPARSARMRDGGSRLFHEVWVLLKKPVVSIHCAVESLQFEIVLLRIPSKLQ